MREGLGDGDNMHIHIHVHMLIYTQYKSTVT